VLGACAAAAVALRAQDKNPFAGDAKAAKLGESQFRANCAFCHGLGARGGGRGPDLSRAQKHHGNSDADLFRTINEGVPGTAMPPNGATQQGVGMTEEEIWQVISYIRSVQVKAPAQPAGNAAHGKELFYGSAACSTCHMIQGKGGRLGPDLSTTGSARSTDYLVESMRSPSRRLAQGISEAMKEPPIRVLCHREFLNCWEGTSQFLISSSSLPEPIIQTSANLSWTICCVPLKRKSRTRMRHERRRDKKKLHPRFNLYFSFRLAAWIG